MSGEREPISLRFVSRGKPFPARVALKHVVNGWVPKKLVDDARRFADDTRNSEEDCEQFLSSLEIVATEARDAWLDLAEGR